MTVSGKGGVLRCKADDAVGHFDVPREVVTTALGGAENLAALGGARAHRGSQGQEDQGRRRAALAGWLSLSTTSTETASFKCSGVECAGTTIATCQDCRTSLCKTEFDACTADATCPFLRTCLDACTTTLVPERVLHEVARARREDEEWCALQVSVREQVCLRMRGGVLVKLGV